jgi:hypothetical protein
MIDGENVGDEPAAAVFVFGCGGFLYGVVKMKHAVFKILKTSDLKILNLAILKL